MVFRYLIVAFLFIAVCLPSVGFSDSLMPPPDHPLLEAVKRGDLQSVKSILQETPSTSNEIGQKGYAGDTPLMVAARNGNLEIVKLLIEHGATIDLGKEAGERTPLLEAAGQGHVEILKYLIAKGADVNARGKGLTPLIAACSRGYLHFGPPGDHTRTIHILLESGADVNVQDESWLKSGRTPLMYAVTQGDAALVHDLLARGAKLDLKNKDGDTASSLAKKAELEYISQLLEKPIRIGTPLSSDLPIPALVKAVKERRLDRVRILIAKGDDVNLRTPSGNTPLMYAADGNSLDILRYLLNHGADVNARNGNNNTALIYAVIKGHPEIVRELLKRKADVNVKNLSRGDALIYAVMGKKPKIADSLLRHGASVKEKYEDGDSALLMTVKQNSTDLARLLIAHKADVNSTDQDEKTALMVACEKGNTEIVRSLLKAGADVSKKSKYGDTALEKAIAAKNLKIVRTLVTYCGNLDRRQVLSSAITAGNLEIFKFLLTKDTDVNRSGFAGGTLLMLAAEGDFEIVRLLVERGADVSRKDDEGQTALMKAVGSYKESSIPVMNFLIDHGADVNAVNNKGETALILAVKNWNAEKAGILVGKGSTISPKDKSGKSAWTYAVEGANQDLVELLEKAGASKDFKGMEWDGYVSKQAAEFIKVVENREEWTELWKRAFDKTAPDVDFEKYAVACVFLGYSADWLYSIHFGQPIQREDRLVISYALHELMLRLSGPFKAGGQYHMQVFERRKGSLMVLEESGSSARRRK
jgi:ankyrin repeat protein